MYGSYLPNRLPRQCGFLIHFRLPSGNAGKATVILKLILPGPTGPSYPVGCVEMFPAKSAA